MTAKPRYPERSHARHTRTPKPDPTLTGQRPSAEKASADHPPHPHPRTYDQTRPPAYSRGQITPPWLEPDQLDIATRWRGVLLRASSDSRSPGVPIHPGDHNRCADPQRLLDPVGGSAHRAGKSARTGAWQPRPSRPCSSITWPSASSAAVHDGGLVRPDPPVVRRIAPTHRLWRRRRWLAACRQIATTDQDPGEREPASCSRWCSCVRCVNAAALLSALLADFPRLARLA